MPLSKEEKQMYRDFMKEFHYCMACWIQPLSFLLDPITIGPLQNAHIVGGSGRRHDRRCIVRLCQAHHKAQEGERVPITDKLVLFGMNIEHLLYLKQRLDPEHYDLDFIKSLRIKKCQPIQPRELPSEPRVHRDDFAGLRRIGA